MSTTIRKILKELAEPKLELHKGDGYLYFVYDDEASNIYLDHSVSVCRLNHLSHAGWIAEGREFLDHVKVELESRSK